MVLDRYIHLYCHREGDAVGIFSQQKRVAAGNDKVGVTCRGGECYMTWEAGLKLMRE